MTRPARASWLRTKFGTVARNTGIVVCLAAPALLQAQFGVGELQTFDGLPATTEWSTVAITGGSGDYQDPATLEAAIQANIDVARPSFWGPLVEDPTSPFPIPAGRARWSSSGKFISTRTSGASIGMVLASVVNDTTVELAEAVVAYDLGGQASDTEDPGLAGHLVFYSLTGRVNSWIRSDDLSGGVLGSKAATLSLGTWAAGAPLYFLWVDDNAAGTEGIYTIDNFQVLASDGTPPQFLSAAVDPYNANVVHVKVDEPLCQDFTVCGSNARTGFFWHVREKGNPNVQLGVTDVVINGLDVVLTTGDPRLAGVSYTLNVDSDSVGDLFGNTIPESQTIEILSSVIGFRNGSFGYEGTQDTFVISDAPDTLEADQLFFEADAVTAAGGVSQGLLRFADIIGSNPNQIPTGAEILSARLQIQHTRVDADGSIVNLHRMLVPWDEATATWNTLGDGVQLDDVEALAVAEARVFSAGLTLPFVLDLDVTASVKAWLDGEPNHGWVLVNTADNGYRPDSSESATPPGLVVQMRVCSGAPTIPQPPANASPAETESFTLTAGVVACNAAFQWTKNGQDIPGANQASYTEIAVAGPGGSSGLYRLRVTDLNGTVTSAPATVTVINDTTRPRIVSVLSGVDGTTITLRFSEALDIGSAETEANYSLSPSVGGIVPVLAGDGTTVTLSTGVRAVDVAYTLTVRDVTDDRFLRNPVDPNPMQIRLTGVQGILDWSAAEWFYATNSQDFTLVDVPWYAAEFVPGGEWLNGQGLFGFEDSPATLAGLPAPIATPLQPNNITAAPDLFVTTYFRRFVSLPPLPAGSQYVLCTVFDDGVIFYVDGVELDRFNMPEGQPLFANVASANIDIGNPFCFPIAISAGDHWLAAEVHQSGLTTDVLFGADIRIVATPELNITRSTVGDVTLLWSADSMFDLFSAPDNVAGPYSFVPGTLRSGSLTVPKADLLNATFYRLQLP